MKMNAVLLNYMENKEYSLSDIYKKTLDEGLKKILDQGFKTSSSTGCTYFEKNECKETDELMKNLQDLTGLECFFNDVAIDDHADSNSNMLIQGILFAKKLSIVLTDIKSQMFKVILSYDPDNDTCTVRFHQVRQSENWIDDDLDSYKIDGIGLLLVD